MYSISTPFTYSKLNENIVSLDMPVLPFQFFFPADEILFAAHVYISVYKYTFSPT